MLLRTEHRLCTVTSLQDRDTERVFGSCDVTKALLAEPKVAYCVAGNVNSADGLFLVIDPVLADTKHVGCSTVPVFSDGAGGSPIG